MAFFEPSKQLDDHWILVTKLPTSFSRAHSFMPSHTNSEGLLNIPNLPTSSSTPATPLPLRMRTRRTKRKRLDGDSVISEASDIEDSLEMPVGRDAAYLLDLPRKRPKVYTPEELAYDASQVPPDELLERVKESKLTNLQILISIAIIKSPNFEARLDYILNFVCQNYTCLIGRDGNPKATDPKRAVLASLSKNASSSPLFIKIGEHWRIGPKNVLYGCKEVITGLMEYITVAKTNGDSLELTELQKMIMRAISLDGGTCPLEKIYEYVKPRYDRLKRRDGTSYASNARRAIQASLSNNSSNRPIFQLTSTNGDEMLWSLTERGLEALEAINATDPEHVLSEESDEDKTVDASPPSPNSLPPGASQSNPDSSFDKVSSMVLEYTIISPTSGSTTACTSTEEGIQSDSEEEPSPSNSHLSTIGGSNISISNPEISMIAPSSTSSNRGDAMETTPTKN